MVMQELEASLVHLHDQSRQAAQQEFSTKITRMQYLLSTASCSGILNPPVAAAMGCLPAVGGVSLEEHIRRTSKAQVSLRVACPRLLAVLAGLHPQRVRLLTSAPCCV
jgi:hypothetical protein